MSNVITALLVIGGLVLIIAAWWIVILLANLFRLRGRPGKVEVGVADKWSWVPWLLEPPGHSRRVHDSGSHDDAGSGHQGTGHHGSDHQHSGDGGHHSG